ncbi:hypothetical protein PPERSA_01810 [Pseudocohnilembus persalinus]|uniref:Uncharacterized protein n=1 Tax=Pseudocohnilembus persalinus TaxID=266149 RepID=A0A0V0QL62_PSEPJ|nr:hypothetical protein PPERSA_01810 [Pseudocohnilembus persalinus]|eukprot:KRX02693.1 hypothetical protein PPERSA_01810 [Pseudocohnilembus persalinus]
MLARDDYQADYIVRYAPKMDLQTFSIDMYQKNVLHAIAFDKSAQVETQEHWKNQNFRVIGTLCFSLAVMIGHKKIPLIKKIEKPWKKFFWKAGVFFIPMGLVAGLGDVGNQVLVAKQYQNIFPQYQKFKCNGDVKELNPNVQIYHLE